MAKEIEVFKPKHVIMFTGYAWAKDFLCFLNNNVEPTVIATKKWSEYNINVFKIGNTFYYVSEHPQGKNGTSHVEALVNLIEMNN